MVDLTPEFIEIAEQRAGEMPASVPFHVAAARQLPFPDAQFDLVTMFANLYGHITPRACRLESLVEALRVTKPGGLLFLEATSIRTVLLYWIGIRAMDVMHCLVNPCDLEVGDKLTSDAAQSDVPYAQRHRTHWFSPEELEQELQEASFEIVQATTNVGIMSDSAADSRKYRGQGRLLYVEKASCLKSSRPVDAAILVHWMLFMPAKTYCTMILMTDRRKGATELRPQPENWSC